MSTDKITVDPMIALAIERDGGPAFPAFNYEQAHAIAAAAVVDITDPAQRDIVYTRVRGIALMGLTKRDYFATKAMQTAMMKSIHASPDWRDAIAADAYAMADAMLKARAK